MRLPMFPMRTPATFLRWWTQIAQITQQRTGGRGFTRIFERLARAPRYLQEDIRYMRGYLRGEQLTPAQRFGRRALATGLTIGGAGLGFGGAALGGGPLALAGGMGMGVGLGLPALFGRFGWRTLGAGAGLGIGAGLLATGVGGPFAMGGLALGFAWPALFPAVRFIGREFLGAPYRYGRRQPLSVAVALLAGTGYGIPTAAAGAFRAIREPLMPPAVLTAQMGGRLPPHPWMWMGQEIQARVPGAPPPGLGFALNAIQRGR